MAGDRGGGDHAAVLDELRCARLRVEDDAPSRRLAAELLSRFPALPRLALRLAAGGGAELLRLDRPGVVRSDRPGDLDDPRQRGGGGARLGLLVPAVRDHADLHGGGEVRLLASRGGARPWGEELLRVPQDLHSGRPPGHRLGDPDGLHPGDRLVRDSADARRHELRLNRQ